MLDFEINRPKYKVIAIGPMCDDEERFDIKLEHLLNCDGFMAKNANQKSRSV